MPEIHRKSERAPVIGISSNVVDPRFTGGRIDGIGHYTLALERELAALGAEVLRVGAPKLGSSGLIFPSASLSRFAAPLPLAVAVSAVTGMTAIGASNVEQAVDVYHATDYMVPRLRHTPVVATLYDAIPLRHPEWANPKWRRVKNWILRSAAASADRAIAISNAGAAEIVDSFPVSSERVRVVPLGVDAVWFEPPIPDRVVETLGTYGLQRGFFLFVGTLQPRKNVAGLLAAYDRLPASVRSERQLVIVGKPGWNVDAQVTELNARRAAGRCIWLNYVDTATLLDLYAAAGALVFPTLAEGFGLPVLEAMAAGLPVIASDLPALREVGGDLVTYVAAGDVDALAAAMGTADDGAGNSARAGARKSRAASYSWRRCAEQTLVVYRELL